MVECRPIRPTYKTHYLSVFAILKVLCIDFDYLVIDILQLVSIPVIRIGADSSIQHQNSLSCNQSFKIWVHSAQFLQHFRIATLSRIGTINRAE
ncbi:hypothetical protein MPTK1_3g18740 [Marchantia polymorpha subsp. ruderalis]|uniref:Uncharacterized protein n=2 Tax=Marchantia polymorpha TaxID=3197 RepID=A0AAF6B2A9_MARPO|nr:hypothetical protein MARPO_0142s0020 [Marchantia polymorpha]BBN06143.1 hypothetical protein Mp_3g18740 [Marchantia polymorpha subsp. ruderalis]|eukprot:PTQ29390.1 hypothetical protein MARPO_0142s0020 [Marchantia polymorpha]